jgi:hypothetical protein
MAYLSMPSTATTKDQSRPRLVGDGRTFCPGASRRYRTATLKLRRDAMCPTECCGALPEHVAENLLLRQQLMSRKPLALGPR